MKNSTCPWGKGKHTSTATTPAGPEEEMAAPEAMARVIKPRKCHPLKSPNTVPEHRAPVNGVQYDPKVLQLIIRRMFARLELPWSGRPATERTSP